MKILIVKLHALGDLVIASPAVRRLREGLPEAQIDLLTTDWTAPAMENNPVVDNTIVAPNELFFKPGLHTMGRTFRLLNQIRRECYDAAVMFHVNKGIDYFIRFTGIDKRIMFTADYDDEGVYLDPGRHSALTACELADYAISELSNKSLSPADLRSLRYEWYISDEENSQALSILKSVKIEPRKFIAIFPGGGVSPGLINTVKRWNVSGFVDVAEYAIKYLGLTPVLMGGKSDCIVCEEVARLSAVDCVNLAGLFNMRISAAILSNCRLAITNDSGPLHVAAAVGVPVVGIFGPTGVEQKLPPGENVVSANLGLPCSPCYFGKFKGCIFSNIKCFEELTSEKVTQAIDSLMEISMPSTT